jgi:hypothetical protein
MSPYCLKCILSLCISEKVGLDYYETLLTDPHLTPKMDGKTRKRLREAKSKARSELDAKTGWNALGLAKSFDKTKWNFVDNVQVRVSWGVRGPWSPNFD